MSQTLQSLKQQLAAVVERATRDSVNRRPSKHPDTCECDDCDRIRDIRKLVEKEPEDSPSPRKDMETLLTGLDVKFTHETVERFVLIIPFEKAAETVERFFHTNYDFRGSYPKDGNRMLTMELVR